MKRNAMPVVPISAEGELKSLIQLASRKTRLCLADVMRTALRVGVPEVVRRFEIRKVPRRSPVEYLDAFAGLVKPKRELVSPSRFI